MCESGSRPFSKHRSRNIARTMDLDAPVWLCRCARAPICTCKCREDNARQRSTGLLIEIRIRVSLLVRIFVYHSLQNASLICVLNVQPSKNPVDGCWRPNWTRNLHSPATLEHRVAVNGNWLSYFPNTIKTTPADHRRVARHFENKFSTVLSTAVLPLSNWTICGRICRLLFMPGPGTLAEPIGMSNHGNVCTLWMGMYELCEYDMFVCRRKGIQNANGLAIIRVRKKYFGTRAIFRVLFLFFFQLFQDATNASEIDNVV